VFENSDPQLAELHDFVPVLAMQLGPHSKLIAADLGMQTGLDAAGAAAVQGCVLSIACFVVSWVVVLFYVCYL
jgi:hypothetical protein